MESPETLYGKREKRVWSEHKKKKKVFFLGKEKKESEQRKIQTKNEAPVEANSPLRAGEFIQLCAFASAKRATTSICLLFEQKFFFSFFKFFFGLNIFKIYLLKMNYNKNKQNININIIINKQNYNKNKQNKYIIINKQKSF